LDPLTVSACVAALVGVGGGWHWHQRAGQAEAEATKLRDELRVASHAASHDPLTGLPNRRAFYQIGSALVTGAQQRHLFVVVFDLDNFKQINDTFGHAVGDEVLVAAARRFQRCAGHGLVARLGGDEFAGLFTSSAQDCGWLTPAAKQLAEELAAPIPVASCYTSVTASVGLAPVDGCAHLAEAIHRADLAMFHSKRNRASTTRLTSLATKALDSCHPPQLATPTNGTDLTTWTVRDPDARRVVPLQGASSTLRDETDNGPSALT